MSARDGFEQFYADHYRRVWQYAARRFGVDEAEDIAQETMLRAYRHFDEIDDARSVEPWLATIAWRIGVDHGRRARPVAVDAGVIAELAPSEPDRSADVAVRVDVGGLLRRALQRLTPHDREVLTLHEVCGVAVRDIAADAGTSSNTIRQRLFRARLNLQRHYYELGGGEYAPVPPGAGARTRLMRSPVDLFVRAARRVATRAGGLQPGEATAVAAVIAVTMTLAPAAPQHPPVTRAVPATTVAAAPALPRVIGRVGTLPTAALAALDRPLARHDVPLALPYADGFETGLSGWTVSGRYAGVDCVPSHRLEGRCALRLDPDGSVRVSRPVDLALGPVVRATFAVRTGRAPAVFGLGLDTADVSVTVDPGHGRLAVAAPSGTTSVALVSRPWYEVVVTIDRATGVVEAAQNAWGQPLAPAVLTLSGSPGRIQSVAFGARGRRGEPVWVDQLQLLPGAPQCSDGVDNDGDGRVDQADPGCYAMVDDTESPDPQCSDGVDNDGDGTVDMADPSCSYPGAGETSACSDRIDDDGDGSVDYPADPDCDSQFDDSERPACSDGADNESDGTADYPADPGCSGPGDDNEAACDVVRIDGRGVLSLAPAVPDPMTKTHPSGVCFDPLGRLEPVLVVAQAPATAARGYLDQYRYAGHDLLCVTGERDGSAAGACASFGARFVRRVAVLVSASAETVPGASGRAYLCTATVMVDLNHSIASPANRDAAALTLC